MRAIGYALLAVLCLFLCSCADMFRGPRSAVIGSVTVERGVDDVDTQVREDGYYVVVSPLKVYGCLGEDIVVQVFSGRLFLGERTDDCTYTGTEWDRFRVFVPRSRLGRMGKDFALELYVVPARDRKSYLQTQSLTCHSQDEQTWEVLDLAEDADLPDGEKGVQVKARLLLAGHTGEDLPLLLLLTDPSGQECKDADGNRLRLRPTTLTAHRTGASSVWETLTLNVPYRVVEHLGQGTAVVLTPALVYPDGQYREGNIHVTFYVGGALATQERRLQEEKARIEELIRSRERELEILRGGSRR